MSFSEESWSSCTRQALTGVLPALRANAEIFHCFVIQPPPFVSIPQRFAHDAPGNSRTEVISVIKAVHGCHHFLTRQAGIFDVRQLMSAAVGNRFCRHRMARQELLVEFSSR